MSKRNRTRNGLALGSKRVHRGSYFKKHSKILLNAYVLAVLSPKSSPKSYFLFYCATHWPLEGGAVPGKQKDLLWEAHGGNYQLVGEIIRPQLVGGILRCSKLGEGALHASSHRYEHIPL